LYVPPWALDVELAELDELVDPDVELLEPLLHAVSASVPAAITPSAMRPDLARSVRIQVFID
jgi:hypothetical protein